MQKEDLMHQKVSHVNVLLASKHTHVLLYREYTGEMQQKRSSNYQLSQNLKPAEPKSVIVAALWGLKGDCDDVFKKKCRNHVC